MYRRLMGVTAGLAVTALATAGTVGEAAAFHDDGPPDRSRKQQVVQQMVEAGLQVARKHTSLPTVRVGDERINAANPYLALIPDQSTVDWSYWRTLAADEPDGRAVHDSAKALVYDERESAGVSGTNETMADLERLRGFGLGGSRNPAVRVIGQLTTPSIPTRTVKTHEDQGSIPSATPTRMARRPGRVEVSSRIGDGPHGSSGTGSGDFDFYQVSLATDRTVDVSTIGSPLDTLVVLYDSTGKIVAASDDANGTLQSQLTFTAPSTGDYYVMVAGFSPGAGVPVDPFDSSTGEGAGAEGRYGLSITVGTSDTDYYGVHLRPGDVLGGSIRGSATDVMVHTLSGSPRVRSTLDVSFIYPMDTPLPGGGNAAFAYVAERAGWYGVSTGSGEGPYHLRLETYRPGAEMTRPKTVQTVFLDFDGARFNTADLGGDGVARLSPLSDFLADWGLRPGAENRLVDRVVATVRENIRKDLERSGLADDFRVRLVDSRDKAKPFGRRNVSRVVVGGTVRESGVFTIGIAESIDPGNFNHEETALILLDIMSSPDRSDDASLNRYLRRGSDRLRFVGTALGNVTSHEIGHLIGSFHVKQFNRNYDLMDQGGNFAMLYGVGPDNIGGTADDVDVDFGIDDYVPAEGLTGRENTYNTSLWAFVRGQGQ